MDCGRKLQAMDLLNKRNWERLSQKLGNPAQKIARTDSKDWVSLTKNT